MDLPAEIPDPERLPRRPEVRPASADSGRGDEAPIAVEVLITDAGPEDPRGVALLDGDNRAPLVWRALADAEQTPEGLRLRLDPVPTGDYIVALAAAPDRARYSYHARARLDVETGGDRTSPVLDARRQDVTVHTVLHGRPEGSLPPVFRLSRVDDPLWHPPIPAGGIQEDPMTVPTTDGVLRLRGLGPGRYALEPLEGTYAAFELSVPGPGTVTATYRP